MTDHADLQAARLERWRQTPTTRIAGPEEAVALIEQLGIATLYPASPEVPDLFRAYVGDAQAATQSEWDSPSGEVYTWRWTLGRRQAAFYSALVRDRPTYISWRLLPAVLRLRGELRPPAALFAEGRLSADAHRVAGALEEASGALSTAELRAAAGFPTGKEQRAAYLRAVADLDTRLVLAKVFAPDGTTEEMRHGLVSALFPQHVAAAERLTREEALAAFLEAYLPSAVYALPILLARHLKLPEEELRQGLERLTAQGMADRTTLQGQRGACYVWSAGTGS